MSHLRPSSHALHVLDVALAIWVAAWIGLGVAIGINVHELTALSDTVARDGRAVQAVGSSLGSLAAVPVLGGSISKDAAQVEQAGASAARSGASSASSVRALSILLAIAVALLPSVPVFGFYLPVRMERRREAAALRRALREHGEDPAFRAFLARRAINSMGYHRLRAASPVPWAAMNDGRCDALAVAELCRLGIDPRLLHRHDQDDS